MRIATFNLLHGADPVDGRVDLDRLRAAVADLNADVLALQEVDRGQPRSHRADLTAVIADALDAVDWCFLPVLSGALDTDARQAASDTDGPDQPTYGLGLVSRYPVRDWRSLRLPQLPVPYPVRRGPLGIAWVREEPRAALLAELDTPHGPLTVVNTHLSFVARSGRRQLRRLVRSLQDVPDPVLVLGDFNLPDGIPARISGYRPLSSRPTFPVDQPVRQIDHILLRGRFGRPGHTAARALDVSDHRALVVDLKF